MLFFSFFWFVCFCLSDLVCLFCSTYRVDYEPNSAGNYHIEVTLDKEHVKNSPIDVRIEAGAFAGNSLIEQYTFLVRTKDRNGKNLPKGGESKNFHVSFEGPAKVQVESLSPFLCVSVDFVVFPFPPAHF